MAAVVLFSATVLSPEAGAQVSTASLSVEVVGYDGGSLPAVTAVAVNTETGFRRMAATNDVGRVLFKALPPGTYEIRLELEGMVAAGGKVVRLMVGERVRLRLTLQPQVTDAISVTSQVPLVDVFRMDSSTNVTPEQIESLPVLDRKFEQLALITPGAQRDRAEFFNRTGAPVLATGRTSSEVTYLVDGVDFSDPFQGMSRVRFGQDSIREFRVMNRFDTETGRSTGGALSVVTKSGTNELKGSTFGFYRADGMRARGALEEEDTGFSRLHVGFDVGGPIRSDASHFFLSGEYFDEDDTVLFRPGGAFVDLGSDVPHPTEQATGLLSFDQRFGESSTVTFKLNYERKREDNYQVGGVKSEDNGWTFHRDGWNSLVTHDRVLSGDRLNELRVQAGFRRGRYLVNSLDMLEWFSFGSTLKTGGDFIGDGCQDRGYVYEVRDTFHWPVGGSGAHFMRAGGSIEFVDWTYREDRFLSGAMLYATDDGSLPVFYLWGEGSSLVGYEATLLGLFVQDDWRPRSNLTLFVGLRYDCFQSAEVGQFRVLS